MSNDRFKVTLVVHAAELPFLCVELGAQPTARLRAAVFKRLAEDGARARILATQQVAGGIAPAVALVTTPATEPLSAPLTQSKLESLSLKQGELTDEILSLLQ
jgi:hypothetical protein